MIASLLLGMGGIASAQDVRPRNQAVTSIGAQGVRSEALQETAAGWLVGERLRWEVLDDTWALVDARLNVYPDDPDTPLDQSRVRTLAVAYDDEGLWAVVGRHSVAYGGPRLVDGVQALVRTGPWDLGAWGGLAPDLFTTAPALRPGGGPIVAYHQGWASASAVGEVVAAEGGLDRASMLALARASFGSMLDVSGRLDAQLTDADGASGLSDAAVFVYLRPSSRFRFDTFYDAFSSLRYQRSESLDPAVRRYTSRADELGVVDAIGAETVDTSLHHLVGATTRWQSSDGVALRLEGRVRARQHIDPLNRYLRAGPSVAVVGLLDDRLELLVDGYGIARPDLEVAWDAGLTTFVEMGRQRAVAVDTSARVLIDQDYGGELGGYADLFFDWMLPGSMTLAGGGSWIYEPSPELDDVGLGLFVRAQHTLRPKARKPKIVPTP